MVAWPLYAEQRMNTAMLSSWVGIDMPPSNTREEDGVVTREEVAVVAREPISGEKGRYGAEEGARLQEAAAKATQAPGSSSHEAFEAVVAGVTGGAAGGGRGRADPPPSGTGVAATGGSGRSRRGRASGGNDDAGLGRVAKMWIDEDGLDLDGDDGLDLDLDGDDDLDRDLPAASYT